MTALDQAVRKLEGVRGQGSGDRSQEDGAGRGGDGPRAAAAEARERPASRSPSCCCSAPSATRRSAGGTTAERRPGGRPGRSTPPAGVAPGRRPGRADAARLRRRRACTCSTWSSSTRSTPTPTAPLVGAARRHRRPRRGARPPGAGRPAVPALLPAAQAPRRVPLRRPGRRRRPRRLRRARRVPATTPGRCRQRALVLADRKRPRGGAGGRRRGPASWSRTTRGTLACSPRSTAGPTAPTTALAACRDGLRRERRPGAAHRRPRAAQPRPPGEARRARLRGRRAAAASRTPARGWSRSHAQARQAYDRPGRPRPPARNAGAVPRRPAGPVAGVVGRGAADGRRWTGWRRPSAWPARRPSGSRCCAKLWVDLAEVCQALGNAEGRLDALRQAVAVAPGWSLAGARAGRGARRGGRAGRGRRACWSGPPPARRSTRSPTASWPSGCGRRAGPARRSTGPRRRSGTSRGTTGRGTPCSCGPSGWRSPTRPSSWPATLTRDRAGDPRVWLRLARMLHHPRHNDEVLAALDKAMALDPKNVEAHDLKAERLAEMGRFDDALAAAQPPQLGRGDLPLVLQGRAAWVEAKPRQLRRRHRPHAGARGRRPVLRLGLAAAGRVVQRDRPPRGLPARPRPSWSGSSRTTRSRT